MWKRVHFVILAALVPSLSFFEVTFGGDLLFNEEIEEKAVIYKVSPDGSSLRKIGRGLFPEWVPGQDFISYIELKPLGELVVADPEGKEVFRVKEIRNMENILAYSWSPRGKGVVLAASFGRKECFVSYYDMETKKLKRLHRTEVEDLDEALLTTTLEWLPDGERLLFSTAGLLKGGAMALIDAKKEIVQVVAHEGRSPRYFESDKIVFSLGTEVWLVGTDGRDKKKLITTRAPISYLSNIQGRKVILQTLEMNRSKELPSQLLLLDLESNRLEEIKTRDHALFCPRFSPDGRKFTAIGLPLKNGQSGAKEELKPGYYVFDLVNKRTALLKRFDFFGGEGYWLGVYFAGFGNHIQWK